MKIEIGTTELYRSDTIGGIQPEAGDGPGPFLMGASTLTGNEVVDRDAEALGKITGIMLDTMNTRFILDVDKARRCGPPTGPASIVGSPARPGRRCLPGGRAADGPDTWPPAPGRVARQSGSPCR